MASFPILIAPAEEFSSSTPSASTRKVSSESKVISPVPVEVIETPPVPEVMLIEVELSLLPIAIISAAEVPEETVPIFIVSEPKVVPILIVRVISFVAPRLIVPPDVPVIKLMSPLEAVTFTCWLLP